MKNIIERIAVFCFPSTALESTPRYILSLEEQYSLVQNKSYWHGWNLIRKQKLDNQVLICMLNLSLYEKRGKFYKLLMSYYKKYGFSFEIETFLIKRSVYGDAFKPFFLLLLEEYGFSCQEKANEAEYMKNFLQLSDVIQCQNPDVSAFFKQAQKTEKFLKEINQIHLQNEMVKKYGSWVPYPTAHFGELFGNLFEYQGIMPLVEEEQNKELLKIFPSYKSQEALLETRNREWRNRLITISLMTRGVWQEVFGKRNETLFSDEAKGLLV